METRRLEPEAAIRSPDQRDAFVGVLHTWILAAGPASRLVASTRPWGRTPVRAVVDGVSWNTSIWRDKKTKEPFWRCRREFVGVKDPVTP
jgi:hypothetical protein